MGSALLSLTLSYFLLLGMTSLTSADDFSMGLLESKSFEWGTTIALTGTQFPPVTVDPAHWLYSVLLDPHVCHPAAAYLQPWLLSYVATPRALSNTAQRTGFGQVLTHELLLSHLPLIYWKRWGTAIEAGEVWGLSGAPPSTHCPAIPTTQPPARWGTFALEGNPEDWGGLTQGKTMPWSPQCEVWLLQINLFQRPPHRV